MSTVTNGPLLDYFSPHNLGAFTMEHSPNLNGVATALSKVQSTIRAIKKDTRGHNYNYTNIADIMDYLLPILSSNGLAITQLGSGKNLVTMLIHNETGQYLKSLITLPDAKDMDMRVANVAQKEGSIRTYFKRYAICEMVGLTSTDEDNDASPKGFEKPEKEKPKPFKADAKKDELAGVPESNQVPESEAPKAASTSSFRNQSRRPVTNKGASNDI